MYPATTVFSLLTGLLCRTRAIDPARPNFMDTKNTRFLEMHSILDSYFRELRESGVGAEVKRTSVITKEEENVLWEKGVLSVDTPETPLCAVFYYNGKNFCLRGGKEHRALKISQLVRHHDPDHYVYTENGSKIEVAVIISFVLKTRVLLYFHVLRLVSGVTLVFLIPE